MLIVDDNEVNRKLGRDLLRLARFQTLEAGTVGAAIALALEHLPDVILMDLHLPDGDGSDAARALGADSRTAAIPVVALSALALDPSDDWLSAAGFAGYIGKPIDTDTFADVVRRYCSGGRK